MQGCPTRVLAADGLVTANNIRGRALNPFRPATLVVALSLAFAAPISFGADAAASATAPVAAQPLSAGSGLDKTGMDPRCARRTTCSSP